MLCRSRGIPGFTGTSPRPEQRAAGWNREDPATTYAINGLDHPRPWTSGIKGYTGHQLPAEYTGVALVSPLDGLFTAAIKALHPVVHRL